MPVTNNVTSNYNQLLSRISGPMTKTTVTKIAIVGQSNAAQLTPIDTSNLINSQYRSVARNFTGWTAKIGYTANYAAFVHNAAGTLLGTNTPRSSGGGNAWDPGAEPEFLKKGFQRDGAAEIQLIISRSYNL